MNRIERWENQMQTQHHEVNWTNQTIWTGDNLEIMRGMNSNCVDLIYLDPPFNSKANYAAPIGSKAAGAEFKDTWSLKDVDIAWLDLIEAKHPQLNFVINAAMTKSDKSYLVYMAVRILEMSRILKVTGGIYLHCDPTMSHYLKLIMDAIFGRKNFKNEIIWKYGSGGRGAKAIARHFPRNNDVLLYFAKNRKYHQHNGIWDNVVYPLDNLPSHIKKDDKGYFKTAPRGDYTDDSIKQLRLKGRIYETKTGNIRIRYDLKTTPVGVIEQKLVGSVWDIPDMMHTSKVEKQGYPTQKPLALLHRIIKASSNEGDVILDPFCGCATTCVAAQELNRHWVGIDISHKASELVCSRMQEELGLFFSGVHRSDIPRRTDIGKIISYNNIKNKKHLYGEQSGDCNGCKHHFPLKNMTVDHIIPRSKGGTDHIENLQLLCGHCNSVKGDRGMEYLISKITN